MHTLIAFHQNNSSNGAIPDPSSLVKGLARETRLVVGGVYKTNLELGYMHFTSYAMRAKEYICFFATASRRLTSLILEKAYVTQ